MKAARLNSFMPLEVEAMADEASYKIEMLVKDIDKMRDIVHRVQIDLSTMSQKVKDDYAVMFEKISSLLESTKTLHDKVEIIREKELKKEGFRHALKVIFLKHPAAIPTIFAALFFLLQSDFVKNHFLKQQNVPRVSSSHTIL